MLSVVQEVEWLPSNQEVLRFKLGASLVSLQSVLEQGIVSVRSVRI